ncbi:MFS siderochrome iron transporter 1 [Colletotrichum spinosum]|uniref:MFS siderochrome iron transporter 1 n=1 Tax=Colletotrichum spinosum TaxID=1347390 RepID=A0A4R8Q4L2_9PEZI|nr:MFS siderochrome iron transporter 1 [Colletotrichum spinosum]
MLSDEFGNKGLAGETSVESPESQSRRGTEAEKESELGSRAARPTDEAPSGDSTAQDSENRCESDKDPRHGEIDEGVGPLEQLLSTRQVVILLLIAWAFNFALAFSSGIFKVLTPYVTSGFSKHALTATASVVANIISGIIKLPYARLLDVWGRPECMASMVVFTVVGTIMMAACENVETYCAAQVLYFVGFFGIQFSFVILIADCTPLRHRALWMGVIATPSIFSIWACGPASESVLNTIGFRWGFGIWATVLPISSAPLLFLMFKYDRQARRAGLIPATDQTRTWRQSVLHYCRAFDVAGVFLLAAGLSFILLAISIYSYQAQGWISPLIISFILIGCLFIVAFLLYEKHLAPETFLPWGLIKNRTVIFTNILAAALYTSEGVASAYIYSMLIVAFDQTVIHATYINNIEMVGASVANLLIGIAFRYKGRVKYYALLLGVPLFFLGEGLMVSLHIPNPSIAIMIFCQVLLALGSGVMYPIE